MATYTLTGPPSGQQQVASTNFTVTADSTAITGSVRVTPNDGNKGGTFSPAYVDFTAANQAKTFVYTPLVTGAITIKVTNNGGYVNPPNLTYTVALNLSVAINQILWAVFQNFGSRFPFLEITRDGGMSEADAITLRNTFNAYYTARNSRPILATPAKEDKGTSIHKFDSAGRTSRGQTPAGEDTVIHQFYEKSRDSKGLSDDDSVPNRGRRWMGRR